MIDAFNAMTLERRLNKLNEPSFVEMIHMMATEEDNQASSLTDAFNAMTLERRLNSKQMPNFHDLMFNLVHSEQEVSSFYEMTKKKIVEERSKPNMVDALQAMTLERR